MLSVLARSLQCSMTTCKALVIMFSISSVLPDDSRSLVLSRGKQKEKAGAESGAGSEEEKREITSKHLNLYLRHNPIYSLFISLISQKKVSSLVRCAHRWFWPLSEGQCGCAAEVLCGAQPCPGPPAPRPYLDRRQVSAIATSRAQRAQLEKNQKKQKQTQRVTM